MIDGQTKVIAQVIQERRMQDRQWGGEIHDNSHSEDDWLMYLHRQFVRAHESKEFRQRMIKLAALAVAAVEALDRKATS